MWGGGGYLLTYFLGLKYFQGGLRNIPGGGVRNFRGGLRNFLGGGLMNFRRGGGVIEKFQGG